MTEFDRATAVRELADGRYGVTVHDGWGAPVGPNGGYVAALVLHAMLAASNGRPERAPRSLTLHFLRAPQPGEAEIAVVEERAGRGLTTLSARLLQGDRLCVLALGALAADYPGALEYGPPPPALPVVADVAPMPPRPGPAILERFDLRPAIGPPPFTSGDEAVTGGWLRLREPRPHDAIALAAYVDAWWPAPWGRLPALSPAPTIDLTIHFRARCEVPPDAHVAVRYASGSSREGFFEEDAEVWAPDGTLLAQSRQLALLPPPPTP